MTNPFAQPTEAWRRFWFAPQPTSTLALFRIAFGLLATGWTLSQAPNLWAFYGPHGILPSGIPGPSGSWGILNLWHGSTAVLVVFAITVAAAVALTVGLFSRIAALVVLVGIISFSQRNGLVTNSGDGLVRNLAFFCALSPSGEAVSIDRLRRHPRRFWEFPARAPWALRLVQLQLSIGYLSAVWHKAGNELWRAGSAVSYSLRMQDIHRFSTPGFITHSVVLTELLTFGTLALELSLGILVWNRAARPWVLVAGVTLHLSIDFSILVGFFSYGMLCGYLAFISPETSQRLILAARDRVRRRRRQTAAVETTSAALAQT
jgi:Vitamin K-dependent gamma-carboxylase